MSSHPNVKVSFPRWTRYLPIRHSVSRLTSTFFARSADAFLYISVSEVFAARAAAATELYVFRRVIIPASLPCLITLLLAVVSVTYGVVFTKNSIELVRKKYVVEESIFAV